MTLGGVRAGDIVLADRKGRRFYAIVIERRDRELTVEPIDRRVTYRHVKAREVVGIWRKSRAQNGRVVEALRRRPTASSTVTGRDAAGGRAGRRSRHGRDQPHPRRSRRRSPTRARRCRARTG